jgi:hypothetical protein
MKKNRSQKSRWTVPLTKLGISIEETNPSIGIPASIVSVRYRNKKMPDCLSLVRYRTGSGTVSLFHSGLTGCRTVWYSAILKFEP